MIELTILLVQYFILKPLGLYTPPPNDRKIMREWLTTIGFYDKKRHKKQ
jgi:hypothetical protein